MWCRRPSGTRIHQPRGRIGRDNRESRVEERAGRAFGKEPRDEPARMGAVEVFLDVRAPVAVRIARRAVGARVRPWIQADNVSQLSGRPSPSLSTGGWIMVSWVDPSPKNTHPNAAVVPIERDRRGVVT